MNNYIITDTKGKTYPIKCRDILSAISNGRAMLKEKGKEFKSVASNYSNLDA